MKYFVSVLFFMLLFVCADIKASDEDILLSRDQVRQSVVDTLTTLNEVYVFPEKAKLIESEVLSRMHQGAYDHIKSTNEFRKFMTDELIEVSADGHLGIMLVKDEKSEPTHVIVETEDIYKNNYAFEKVEILSGNVGYLKFNKFYIDDEAVETVDYAFGFLKDTDAMIIDLRDCIGGSPELVRYMSSYFFNEKTLLWRIHTRADEEIFDHETMEEVGHSNFKNDFPVFILVGPETASAAEMFSYTLQHYNKATIVGEKTNGIAYAVGAAKINQYFVGRFSMNRPVNPVTQSDWEIVGVLPDIKASLAESLDIAHSKALNNKSSSAKNPANY